MSIVNPKTIMTLLRVSGNDRGISIIGTVFTLIILGVLGAALISLVAMEQESRMRSIHREYGFYAVQAGFEYALREIKEGGYPIVTDKALEHGAFTTAIDASLRKITAIGIAGDVRRTYSITTDLLGMDCMRVDTSGVVVGGPSGNQLQNISLTKECLNAVTIDAMTFEWTPDLGEEIRRIRINGVDVYDDLNGASSGDVIDIADTRIVGTAVIEVVEFNAGISGKNLTLALTFTDSSAVSASMVLP